MDITGINASSLAAMFLGGAKNLEAHKDHINELNVFPVPDGDTGTNMTMTIQSAANAVTALGENPEMKAVCKAISSGSLRGARGNSGVILSQLFRGFTKGIADYDTLTVDVLCDATQRAVETAYKAVIKPKEGTILTVARGAADRALELADETEDLVWFVSEVVRAAEDVLSHTPEMLPVLAQAGVVDSGGQGLLEVLKGAYNVLIGEDPCAEVVYTDHEEVTEAEPAAPCVDALYSVAYALHAVSGSFTREQLSEIHGLLEKAGTIESFDAAGNGKKIVVLMTAQDPGSALSAVVTYGVISQVEVSRVVELAPIQSTKPEPAAETEEKKTEDTEADAAGASADAADDTRKSMGFVAVSIGEGLNQLFRDLGCDAIIEGGQTMNPSTEDLLVAIESVDAKSIFVLPNNKNIIMAANQASELCEDKNVIVIPTKSIPQGITALINFIPEQSPFDNEGRMLEEIKMVRTGQVTYAVRDTVIDDKEIHSGDFMGIGDAGILSVGPDLTQTFLAMIDAMADENSAILTVYYGEDVTAEDAETLSNKVSELYPDLEIETVYGGQPVYYYTVSLE